MVVCYDLFTGQFAVFQINKQIGDDWERVRGGLGELAWIFIADRLLTDKETNEGIPRTQKWRPEDYNTLRHVAGYCLVIIWALTKHRDDTVVATGSTSWPWSWRTWWPKMAQNPLRVYFASEWPLLGGLFSELFCSDRSKWDLHWIALTMVNWAQTFSTWRFPSYLRIF